MKKTNKSIIVDDLNHIKGEDANRMFLSVIKKRNKNNKKSIVSGKIKINVQD